MRREGVKEYIYKEMGREPMLSEEGEAAVQSRRGANVL